MKNFENDWVFPKWLSLNAVNSMHRDKAQNWNDNQEIYLLFPHLVIVIFSDEVVKIGFFLLSLDRYLFSVVQIGSASNNYTIAEKVIRKNSNAIREFEMRGVSNRIRVLLRRFLMYRLRLHSHLWFIRRELLHELFTK